MGFNIIEKLLSNDTFISHLVPENSKFYFIISHINSFSWHDHLLFSLFLALYGSRIYELWKTISRKKQYRKCAMSFKMIMKTLNGIPLTMAILPFFLPVYFILLLYSKIVERKAVTQFGDSVSKGKGMDMVWGSGSKFDKPIITVAMKLEGKLNIEKVKKQLQYILLNVNKAGDSPFRKFKQTFNKYCGIFFWKYAENFNLDNHIRIVELLKLYPTDAINDTQDRGTQEFLKCQEQLLCRFISDRSNESIPSEMPQWEIIFLTQGADREYTALFRLHHAIGDGTCLMRFMLEILADNPTKVSMLGPPPRPVVRFLTFLWSMTVLPFTFKYIFFKGSKNPLHGKKLTGKKIFVTSEDISLDLVKKIKKKTKATITDILLSCLSYSLSSFFTRRFSNTADITIMFPIGFEDLTKPISLTNTFAMGLTTLPTPTEENLLSEEELGSKPAGPARSRLNKVQDVLDAAKKDPTLISMYWVTSLFCSVLPASLSEYIFRTSGVTMGVSNVPGPQKDIYMWDSRVSEMRFWVPDRSPTGAGFTIMSYNGAIRLGFCVDEGLIKERDEAEQIIDGFGKELKRLAEESEIE